MTFSTNATVLVGFLLLASGCLGGHAPVPTDDLGTPLPAPGLGVIEGSIVNDGFDPINGATIRLRGIAATTSSDATGHFRFHGLSPAAYTLDVTAMGWRAAEATVTLRADEILRVTIFLDRQVILDPYHLTDRVDGKIKCVVVEAAGQSTREYACDSTKVPLNFPEGWAATMTEVSWGPSGYSSASDARITLGYTDAAGKWHTYKGVVSKNPARLPMMPETLYDANGGDSQTPAKGEKGPLVADIWKAPTEVLSNTLYVGATIEQSFVVLHTTFYHEPPENLDSFTAAPDP